MIRSDDSGVTVYLPGGQEITIDGTEVSASRYYSFGGMTVAVRTSSGLGGVSSLVSDPQGSVIASVPNTNWTASSLERIYTDPFGAARDESDSGVPGDHRFLGAVRDDASGLVLLGARYYDEAVGRFLSVDPVLDRNNPAQFNAYSYAWNNPATFSDPSGLIPDPTGNGPSTPVAVPKITKTMAPPPPTSYWAQPPPRNIEENIALQIDNNVNIALGIRDGAVDLGVFLGKGNIFYAGFMLATDPDTFWEEKRAEGHAMYATAINPLGALDNAWNALLTAWDENPAYVGGGGLFTALTCAIPGGFIVKGLTGASKIASAGSKIASVPSKPSFVVRPNGEVNVIPTGAAGPTPTKFGNGQIYSGGTGGGFGLNSAVTGTRIMDAGRSGGRHYSNGYSNFTNASDQVVNPVNGRTIDPSHPWWHWTGQPVAD